MIIDIGGVLVHDRLTETVDRWARRLAMSQADMLAAIYGGNDDAVLVGRVSEDEWWEVVRDRLGINTSRLRADLESGQTWNDDLIALLRDLKATTRTAILSNAWPSQRSRMAAVGLADVVHDLLLSCEIGYAKPNVSAFKVALQCLATDPARTLFVDDTAGHVDAAAALGMHVHLHSSTKETIEVIRKFVGGT